MKQVLFILLIVCVLMSCTGEQGLMGPSGNTGNNGTDGSNGIDGVATNGSYQLLPWFAIPPIMTNVDTSSPTDTYVAYSNIIFHSDSLVFWRYTYDSITWRTPTTLQAIVKEGVCYIPSAMISNNIRIYLIE